MMLDKIISSLIYLSSVCFQSCQTSLRLEELLYRAQKDPVTSKLAALLHQRRGLLRDTLTTNLAHSTLMATVTQSLEKDWQVRALWLWWS